MEIEQEVPSDPEDPRELHPGALLHRSSRLHNLPLMAEALAHGADVHTAAEEEEGKTPLIQAVMGVSVKIRAVSIKFGRREAPCCKNTGFIITLLFVSVISRLITFSPK